MGLLAGVSKLAKWIGSHTVTMLYHRWWSHAARHCGPLDCYAIILSAVQALSEASVRRLERNWKMWMHIELLRHTHAPSRALFDDLSRFGIPERMLHIAFERDKYARSSHTGRRLLRGQLYLVPHNKPAAN